MDCDEGFEGLDFVGEDRLAFWGVSNVVESGREVGDVTLSFQPKRTSSSCDPMCIRYNFGHVSL